MLRIQAQRVSSAVRYVLEPGWHAEVHSVFHKVINLNSEGHLVTIADQEIGELPNGLIVAIPAGSSFDAWLLSNGSPGYTTHECLLFPGIGLEIGLTKVSVFEAKKSINISNQTMSERSTRLTNMLETAQRLAPTAGLCGLWFIAGAILLGNKEIASLTTPLDRTAFTALVNLVRGCRKMNPVEIMQGARGLVGLGVGLTPSGDDVLTGFTATIALWEDVSQEDMQAATFKSNILQAVEGKMNLISDNYLKQALRCEVSDKLARFIDYLSNDVKDNPEREVKDLFAFGATSGCELGLGAFLASALMTNIDPAILINPHRSHNPKCCMRLNKVLR